MSECLMDPRKVAEKKVGHAREVLKAMQELVDRGVADLVCLIFAEQRLEAAITALHEEWKFVYQDDPDPSMLYVVHD